MLFGFCNVITSVVVPPAENVAGVNRLVRPMSLTVKRAVAGVEFVSPCCVWSALAGILLVNTPWTFEVTLTVIVQVEFGAIVPLFKVTEVPPLIAVNEAEAPHPDNVGETGFARTTLAGKLSVRAA